MSGRAETLIRDWETRLHANALASQILATLNGRKSEMPRCALDGLARENPQFERATTKQFRVEAVGHCDTILQTMLAIATGRAAALGPDPFGFVQTHAVRRARQQFPLAGSLNAYRLAHKGYWEVMRNSVASTIVAESEKTDCLMILSEFLLEFFDRVSGVMTDAYIAEEKLMIARSTRAHVALIEDLLHGRQPGDLEAQGLSERCGMHSGSPIAVVIGRISRSENGQFHGAGRLERLSDFFHRALSPLAFGRLIDIRNDEVLAILTAGAQTSKRVLAAFAAIAAELKTELNEFARIGISLDATEISALPQGYQEAERAVEFAKADRPILHFLDIDLMEFLVGAPTPRRGD
jgi:GGDEF-like domain